MKKKAMSTPMKTVHPISRPWIRQAQRMAGWKRRGSGRRVSFQKESDDLRPLKRARDWMKVAFSGMV